LPILFRTEAIFRVDNIFHKQPEREKKISILLEQPNGRKKKEKVGVRKERVKNRKGIKED
jgi:hypothetical protein